MGIILKREDLMVEGEPGEYFDVERLENDIKEISNKDPEGRIKVLHKMRPIAIFKPTNVGPSGRPEEICIEGEPPYIKMRIHIDDAYDYYISNVECVKPVCLSKYIVKYKQYHYRWYDHTRGEDSVLLKPGDMIKLTAVDNYRALHDVGCIVAACSTDTLMLSIADPKLVSRAIYSGRYDSSVVTTIVLKADILGDENDVKEFQIEKIE
jgi:hypothetical protein